MEIPRPEDTALTDALGALASPTRLALLRALRTPRALAEIEVGAEEGGRARPLARQTIREHLEKLLQAGLVSTREGRRERREALEFVTNHQAAYALSEELRGLSRLRPAVEPDAPTAPGDGAEPLDARGPALVVVKGPSEGLAFDLRPVAGGPAEWRVGRRRGLAVCLDHDAAVSAENARVWWEENAHWIEDLPESRNGVRVNFRLLPKGQRRRLRHGDVVGVGRTLLLYWS